MAGIVKEYSTNVTDGVVDIEFLRVTGNPQVNGIEIHALGTPSSARMALPDTKPSNSDVSGRFRAYPNPSTSTFNFEFSSKYKDQVILEVYKLNGEFVEQAYSGEIGPDQSLQLQVKSTLAPGIYIGKLRTSQQESFKLLMIQ